MAPESQRERAAVPPSDDEVEQLVVECLRRLDEEGPSGVEALCLAHPEHASAVREQLSRLQRVGLLTAPSSKPAAALPERLGDFRLLRRLGEGGMGVVYLARQETLDRTVALKLIRPEQLYFPGAHERFRREIEAVSRLQHPGIVAVHTVGEEQGIPYFAMEHVDGCSLADVLTAVHRQPPERLTGADFDRAIAQSAAGRAPCELLAAARSADASWVEMCFRIVLQVADALQHAHAAGVLHRDIKPSNIMLTVQGRVVLLDFGLAALEGTTQLTRTGAALGSVPYMSPEQLVGAAPVDQRTDVYALGVTLYELLTLRPPFHEVSAEATRRRVLEGLPRPPRAQNRAVAWDAETVCLTAMDRDPARRYASAAALASDLRHVLELRPIDARRPSLAWRTRRWVQRHPAWAVGLVLGSLLLIVGPMAFAWRERVANRRLIAAHAQTEAAYEAARRERDSATVLRDRAQRNFQRARQAVDQMLARLGDEGLVNVPGMEVVRRELLEEARRSYEQFVQESAGDVSLRVELGRNLRHLAQIQQLLGERSEVERSLTQSVDELEAVTAEEPELLQAREELAKSLSDLGVLEWQDRQLEAATDHLSRSFALLEAIVQNAPDSVESRDALAVASLNLGILLGDVGDCEGSERYTRGAHAIWQEIVRKQPGEPRYEERAAVALLNLGSALGELDRLDDAERASREAVDQLQRLVARHPSQLSLKKYLAEAELNLAGVLQNREQLAQASASYVRSVALLRQLIVGFPRRADLKLSLVEALDAHAGLLLEERDFAGAERSFEDAATLVRTYRADFPLADDWRPGFVEAQMGLGTAVQELGRTDQANRAFAAASAALDELEARDALTPALQGRRAELILRTMAIATPPLPASDRLPHARRAFDLARASLEKRPARATLARALRDAHRVLTHAQLEAGDAAAASASTEVLVELCPRDATSLRQAAGVWCECSLAGRGAGTSSPAADTEVYLARALEVLESALENGFSDRQDLLTSADLVPLRREQRFAELVQSLER